MSLRSFLTRLIWLCVLPLVLLAAYLAIDSVRTTQSQRDLEAANLAKNYAIAVDRQLNARIGALRMLAASPLADDAARWKELYQEAQGFRQSFGSDVILADLEMHMLFNTRVPFGTALPALPRPKGHAAAPTAMETGKPAVGDTFFGPVANQALVAIAVPGQREGRTVFLVLTVFETRQFQERLDQVALPSGWSLTLLDGTGVAIARRAPPGLNSAADVDAAGRFVVKSALSSWSAVLEIPRDTYRAPLISAGAALAVNILAITLASALGGMFASRRLGREVASLGETPASGAAPPKITEIARVRRLLDDAAEKRASAEAARRESEQRFRATFEHAAVGIALVAPDGRWLQVNRRLCEIVGYSQEELLARTFQDITSPDDVGADLAHLRQMLAGEIETYSTEKRYLRKAGAIVWINVTVALVRGSDGSPDYFISIIEDIQRRKEAEAALQTREATLKEAQGLAGLGNWTWDVRTDRHAWSEEIYRIYGRDPSLPPAVYPEVQAYFTPDSWSRLAAAVETGLALGTPYECDAEVVRPDGSRRWITARGEATRDARGTVVELHGTVQDITERIQAAEALREINASLEQRVELRTAQLTAANRELEAFAYSVSHDLRAPLRSMDGFSLALLEDYGDKLDEDGKDALQRIRAASQRMGELIDDLLRLSQVARAELNVTRVNLTAIAREIADALDREPSGRFVQWAIEPGLSVRADPALTRIAMQNLLQNAWKFSGRTDRAEIRVGALVREGKTVYFVADNGVGFDMVYADKLFGAFQRLHHAGDFPGTGIGLAIVQRIIHRHDGEIWAEAKEGEGATFFFTVKESQNGPDEQDHPAG